MPSKCISVGLLLAAETFVMSLWFASAAVLPEMARQADLAPARQALMTSAVQAGFVVGALAVRAATNRPTSRLRSRTPHPTMIFIPTG